MVNVSGFNHSGDFKHYACLITRFMWILGCYLLSKNYVFSYIRMYIYMHPHMYNMYVGIYSCVSECIHIG